MGRLTDFHVGLLTGLNISMDYDSLTNTRIAELMGVARSTVYETAEKGRQILGVAQVELQSRRLPHVEAAEEEDEEEEAELPERIEQMQARRAVVKDLATQTDEKGKRLYFSARDIFDELICLGYDVTIRTVQADLVANDFVFRPRPKTIPLNDQRKANRLEICTKLKDKLTQFDYQRLVFTDESYFRCEDLTRGMWCDQAAAEQPEPILVDRYSKAKVYVWGAIGVGFKKLKVLEEYTNGENYVKLLSKHVVRDKRFKGKLFMHDGAPAHRAGSAHLKAEGFDLLEWPAYSPDLNPIENLWGHMKMKIKCDIFTNPNHLRAAVEEFWEEIDQSYIDSLVLSFEIRLAKAIELEGEPICFGSKHPLKKTKVGFTPQKPTPE